MPTESSYPGALDIITDPSTTLKGPSGSAHQDAHLHLNDAVEKIEAELGLNPSGADATVAAALAAIKETLDDLADGLAPKRAQVNFTTSHIKAIGGYASATVAGGSYFTVTTIGNFAYFSGRLTLSHTSISFPNDGTYYVSLSPTAMGASSGLFTGVVGAYPLVPATVTPGNSTDDSPTYAAGLAYLLPAELMLRLVDATHMEPLNSIWVEWKFAFGCVITK